MKTLSLKLPDALSAKLTAAARKRQTSKSVLVREALESYLADGSQAQPGSFLDLAADLIGSLDSGEGDLSYNPKHMEGFGR
jgi:predicted DNA-binding protein